VFAYHKLYSTPEQIAMVDRECRCAGIGCVECKKLMAGNLSQYLLPFREKRSYYLSHAEKVEEILGEGTKRARDIAIQTMDEVRRAIKLQ
jgi:tryptophanyl-tRNA synthetase